MIVKYNEVDCDSGGNILNKKLFGPGPHESYTRGVQCFAEA